MRLGSSAAGAPAASAPGAVCAHALAAALSCSIAPVADRDLAGQRGGKLAVVGDDRDRGALAGVQVEEQVEDGGARHGVEVAGRLVGEHDRRPSDDRPGDGDALALAAGELRRAVLQAVPETDLRSSACALRLAGARHGAVPVYSSPLATLSSADSPSSRKNCWKTKPMARERRPESCPSDSPAVSSPATRTLPAVGRSSVPMTCSSVDLPEPDGPTMATSSPACDRRATRRRQGLDRRVAGVRLDARRAARGRLAALTAQPRQSAQRPARSR